MIETCHTVATRGDLLAAAHTTTVCQGGPSPLLMLFVLLALVGLVGVMLAFHKRKGGDHESSGQEHQA